jgi:hypothetical protein
VGQLFLVVFEVSLLELRLEDQFFDAGGAVSRLNELVQPALASYGFLNEFWLFQGVFRER